MQNKFLTCDHCLQKTGGPVILLLTAVLIFNGCGTETYEQRLKETAQYFAYVDARNNALSGNWSSPTVKMRTPVEFKQISDPTPAATTTSEESEPADPEPSQAVDPRQPDYINLILPGLEGAWRVDVPVDQDKETIERPAYLYVLSNHYLLQEKNMDEALNFYKDVNNQLAGTFNQFLNADEFTTERFPKGKGYSEAKSFLVGTFEPETQIAGIPYQFLIYLIEKGNNKVVILLVIPKNIARESKLKEHMDFSLETVDIVSPRSGGGKPNSSSERQNF
tara:strand:- start:29246 stop:30079 length:834 start_codon:yes stop_codon:yes gene_type:complete